MFCETKTVAGRVLGLDHGPVRAFRGIPYGASTDGEGRFAPPRAVPGWTGVRDCLAHGPASPQAPVDPRYTFANLLQFNLAAAIGGMGEDCLHLNIWTPGLQDGGCRPVLVSLHGGGFNNGSGNLPLYDGAQLAIRGDVVVVAVTHRLNVLGYVDLAGAGANEEFAAAGVAGLLDLVAALEWVRDNIKAFGGDPARVTIMGQSGGGWKASCLLAMPGAQGLFNRAIVQSGSLLRAKTRVEGAEAAGRLLAALDLNADRADELRQVPWTSIIRAAAGIGLHLFEPVLDGSILPRHPSDPDLPQSARDLPVMIGTTRDDGAFLYPDTSLTEDALSEVLRQRFADRADELLSLYRRHAPLVSPYLLLGRIVTDAGFRRFAYAQAERIAASGGRVHLYQWNWPSPAFSGVYGAAHATDVPASFANVQDPLLGAGDPEGAVLADRLSGAVLAFARGDELDGEATPWPPFDVVTRSTMIFDSAGGMAEDPDAELRAFWSSMPMAETVFG